MLCRIARRFGGRVRVVLLVRHHPKMGRQRRRGKGTGVGRSPWVEPPVKAGRSTAIRTLAAWRPACGCSYGLLAAGLRSHTARWKHGPPLRRPVATYPARGGHQMSFFTTLPRERYSPDAFRDFKMGSGFELGTARAMAWMSQLAYETNDPKKIESILKDWGLQLPQGGVISEEVATVLPKAATHLVVAVNPAMAIVAFAGTDPVVIANWVSDFDAKITTADVANGYAVAAKAVEPKLQVLLNGPAQRDTIYVTGHSLGGALAILTARAIATKTLPISKGVVEAVYTIGMPRAGDLTFAADYEKVLGSCTYRLVHAEDIVPTVAPSEFEIGSNTVKFHHVGQYLHCDRGGKFDGKALSPKSDDPLFVHGVSKEIASLLHSPASHALAFGERLKLAAALVLGLGLAGMRTDLGGISIELLPQRVRDHMPD